MRIRDAESLMIALRDFFAALEQSQKAPKDLMLFAEMIRKRDDLQILYESIKVSLFD